MAKDQRRGENGKEMKKKKVMKEGKNVKDSKEGWEDRNGGKAGWEGRQTDKQTKRAT